MGTNGEFKPFVQSSPLFGSTILMEVHGDEKQGPSLIPSVSAYQDILDHGEPRPDPIMI